MTCKFRAIIIFFIYSRFINYDLIHLINFFDNLPFPKDGPNGLKLFIILLYIDLIKYYTNNLNPILAATNITSPALLRANIRAGNILRFK